MALVTAYISYTKIAIHTITIAIYAWDVSETNIEHCTNKKVEDNSTIRLLIDQSWDDTIVLAYYEVNDAHLSLVKLHDA